MLDERLYFYAECPTCKRETAISSKGILRRHKHRNKTCKHSGETYLVDGQPWAAYLLLPKSQKKRQQVAERARRNDEELMERFPDLCGPSVSLMFMLSKARRGLK